MMPLVAHWPFNGNGNDISSNDYNITNISTFVDDGKIGHAADTTDQGWITINELNGISTFTIMFWGYNSSGGTGDWMDILWLEDQNMSGTPGNGLRWECTYDTSPRAISFHNNASYNITNGSTIHELNKDTWCHVAFVCDSESGEVRAYSNGQHIYTHTYNNGSLTGLIRVGQSTYLGKINDLRIYNEVVNDLDIQEISRAKIIHYTFDDIQEPTANLHNDPVLNIEFDENDSVPKSNWGVDGTLYARRSTSPFAEDGDLMLEINITSAGSGGLYTDLSRNAPSTTFTLEEGKTYTRSWWVKCSDNINISGHVCSCNRGSDNTYIVGDSIDVTTEWQRFSHTFTVGVGEGGEYHTRHIIYNNIFSVWVANIQVEEKPYPTSFVIGDRSGQVLDYSGQFNHTLPLSIAKTPKWTNNAKIGTGSYEFNAGDEIIYPPSNLLKTYKEFTISAWVYLYSEPTETNIGYVIMQHYGEGGWILSVRGTDEKLQFRHHRNVNDGFTTAYNLLSNTSLNINEWYHVAASDDGATAKVYINGIEDASYTIGSVIPGPSTGTAKIGAFNDTGFGTFDGKIDDVRLYSTTLTSEYIYDIYETKAEVEESGVLYAKTFIANIEPTINLCRTPNLSNNSDQSVGGESFITNKILSNGEQGIEFIQGSTASIVNLTLDIDNNTIVIPGGYMTVSYDIRSTKNDILKAQVTCFVDGVKHWLQQDNVTWSTSVVEFNDMFKGIHTLNKWIRAEWTLPLPSSGVLSDFSISELYRTTSDFTAEITNFQVELKDHSTPFTSTVRSGVPEVDMDVFEYSAGEFHETGISNYEDFSTAGFVDSLEAFWTLHTDSRDFSGNEYISTDTNMKFTSKSGIFSGSSKYILDRPIELPSTEEWSMIQMVKTTSTGTQSIISNSSGGPVTTAFRIVNGYPLLYHYDGSWLTDSANTQVNDGEWHMLVWNNKSDETIDLYIDGVLDKNIPSNISNNGPVDIIGSDWASNYFSGEIAYFKIFNRLLTSEEIDIEYNVMINNEVHFNDSGIVYAKKLKEY